MTECIHGIREDWCGICLAPKQHAEPLVYEGPTIAAKFTAKCGGCGEQVYKGEDIHLTNHGWVCSRCKNEALSA